MIPQFHPSWKHIPSLLNREPLTTLNTQILPNCLYYPSKDNIFRVFRMPLDKIKVVILGQDPYPAPGQANGLAFAVNENIKIPASLNVIFQEIRRESNNDPFTDRSLLHWEEQGVFLLNTALTVASGQPASHTAYWNDFIRSVVNYIAVNQPSVWLLWGKKAQSFIANMPPASLIRGNYTLQNIYDIPANPYSNYVFASAHPAAECYSQGGAGFLGNNHFLFANTVLSKLDKQEIEW